MLRTSLEMAAVAWIPKDPHDAAVISGAVAGLKTASYRGISVAGRPRIDVCLQFTTEWEPAQSVGRRAALRIGGRLARSGGSWRSTRSTIGRSPRPISSDCSMSRR